MPDQCICEDFHSSNPWSDVVLMIGMVRKKSVPTKMAAGKACDGSGGKDVTFATYIILVLLPLLYKLFPHTYASPIRRVNRLSK
jgi:hypothetical protein